MAQPEQNTKVTYTGNGATTNWPFNFEAFQASDIAVFLTPDEVTGDVPVDPVDFNVNGAGVEAGGSVDYPLVGDPLADPVKITITRAMPLAQDYSIVNNDPFLAEDLEGVIDQLTAMIQQLNTDAESYVKTGLTEDPEDYLTDVRLAAAAAATSEANAAASATASQASAVNSQVYAVASQASAVQSQAGAAASQASAVNSEASNVNSTAQATASAVSAAAALVSETNAATSETNAAASEAAVANGQIPGTSITLDSDNVGAAVESAVKFNRGSTSGDAALVSSATSGSFGLFKDEDVPGPAGYADLTLGDTQLLGITAERALAVNSAGWVVSSGTTDTELGYLSGADSNIQDQIDAITVDGEILGTALILDADNAGPQADTELRMTGENNNARMKYDVSEFRFDFFDSVGSDANININSAIVQAATANRALISNVGKLIVSSPTTDTELGYVSGVTSSIHNHIYAIIDAGVTSFKSRTGVFFPLYGDYDDNLIATSVHQNITADDAVDGTNNNQFYVIDSAGEVIITLDDTDTDPWEAIFTLGSGTGKFVTTSGKFIGPATEFDLLQVNATATLRWIPAHDKFYIMQNSQLGTSPSSLMLYALADAADVGGYLKFTTDINDPLISSTPIPITGGPITLPDTYVGGWITDAGSIIGAIPEGIQYVFFEAKLNAGGDKDLDAYYKIYVRDSGGIETLVDTQSDTRRLTSTSFTDFAIPMVTPLFSLGVTDRLVIKFYVTPIGGTSNYTFNVEGNPITAKTQIGVSAGSVPLKHAEILEVVSASETKTGVTLNGSDETLSSDSADFAVTDEVTFEFGGIVGNFTGPPLLMGRGIAALTSGFNATLDGTNLVLYYGDGTTSGWSTIAPGHALGDVFRAKCSINCGTGEVTMQYNGVDYDPTMTGTVPTLLTTVATDLYLGSLNGIDNWLDGEIHYAAISDVADTSLDPMTPEDSLGYWDLNNSYKDISGNSNHLTPVNMSITNFTAVAALLVEAHLPQHLVNMIDTLYISGGLIAGEFEPELSFANDTTLVVVHTVQDGWFIQFANLLLFGVRVRGTMTYSAASGYLQVLGLPYTVNSSTEGSNSAAIREQYDIDYTAGNTFLTATVLQAGDIGVTQNGDGVNASFINTTNVVSTSDVLLSFSGVTRVETI